MYKALPVSPLCFFIFVAGLTPPVLLLKIVCSGIVKIKILCQTISLDLGKIVPVMIIWLTSCYKQTKRSQKEGLLAVFLDVRGAFDNVNLDILLEKLSSIGCSVTLVKHVKSLTHSRSLFTASLGKDYRYSFKGVPQGGVLSPLLYIITEKLQKS